MSDDCKEYNTLKYKTMITTGNNIDVVLKNETNESTLNNYLEKDITKNKNEVWSKLTKTEKINFLSSSQFFQVNFPEDVFKTTIAL